MNTIRQPTWLDTGKIILLGAIWGSSFFGIDVALKDFSPLTIATIRIALAAVLLSTVVLYQKKAIPRSLKEWGIIFLVGFFSSALPFVLIGWGQQSIDSGMAAVLMASGPFIVLALSHFLTTDDRFSINKLISLILGFCGVIVLVGDSMVSGDKASLWGQLAVIGAAMAYAGSSLLVRMLTHLSPLVLTACVVSATSLYLVPITLLLDTPAILSASWTSLAALLYLGLVPTSLAYLLRYQIIQEVGATFISQVGYLIPLFGVFWGWLLLNEQPGVQIAIALVLILVGLAVSRYRGGG